MDVYERVGNDLVFDAGSSLREILDVVKKEFPSTSLKDLVVDSSGGEDTIVVKKETE